MRKALLFLVFQILILSGIIAFQWLTYISTPISASEPKPVEYHINMNYQQGILHISEKITEVNAGNYYLQIPDRIENIVFKLNKKTIQISKRHEINFEFGDELQISYQVPFTNKLNNLPVFLLKSSNEPVAGDIYVDLIEEGSNRGQWYAGGLLLGKYEGESLSYFSWEKKNSSSFALYRSSIEIEKKEYNGVTYYNNANIDFSKLGTSLTDENKHNLVVVINDGDDTFIAPLLAVLPKGSSIIKIKQAQTEAVLKETITLLDDSVEWIWAPLTSVITKNVHGNEFERKIAKELIDNLNEAEQTLFISRLLDKRKIISVKDLDEILSRVVGKSTDFFQLNKSGDFVPLYFYDKRKLHVNDKTVDEAVLILEENSYFPLSPVLTNLGFEVLNLDGNNGFIIRRNGNTWRLYLDKSYFIYNEEDYGVVNELLIKLGGKHYISKELLVQLFGIEIDEGTETLYVK